MNFDTDPDADSDPRIRSLPFLSVILKTKSYFFTTFSCLLLFEGTFTPFSKHKKSHTEVKVKVKSLKNGSGRVQKRFVPAVDPATDASLWKASSSSWQQWRDVSQAWALSS
jgi:hypothetical protein